MSYYQLMSLKLQMGVDPDELIDYKTLLKMWKEFSRAPVSMARPSVNRSRHLSREATTHSLNRTS